MRSKKAFFVLLSCLMSAFVVSAPIRAADVRPVIIDTDMTNDDFMAILYIFNDPQFAVKAITVTGTGWSFCDAGVQVALGMLELTHYGDVPVSCWKEKTLLGGDNPVPPNWRTSMESIKSLNLPEGGKASDLDAAALFTKTVQDTPEKIEVLALGPLTNIGGAFVHTPALVEKIAHITVMGGAVDVPGSGVSTLNTTAEWNIYCDPPAARIVFESGAPITLVGLDATNDVPVTLDFLAQLAAEKKSAGAEFVATALNNSLDFIKSGTYSFWDPLAAAVMADPGLVTHTERNLSVVDTPGREYGRTKAVGNGARIDVVTKPDGETFKQRLIVVWNKGA